MKLLQWIGIASLGYRLLTTVTSTVQDNIQIGFRKVSLQDFNLFTGRVKLSLVITNLNPIELAVKNFNGTIRMGAITTPIRLDKAFSLPSNRTVEAHFTLTIDNADFLSAIANQIGRKTIPALEVIGGLGAGYKDRFITIPIDTKIPLL